MSLLPETNIALAEWNANRQRETGMHMGPRLAVGVPGQAVSEVQYDLIRHVGLRPNVMSLMGLVTGEEYIDTVMPAHPLDVNVVVHHDPAQKNLPQYLSPMALYKQRLGSEISTSIDESLTGYADRARVYVVGEPVKEELIDYGVDVIEGTADGRSAAEATAEICERGLTFVISDFNNFPLHEVASVDFTDTVAIKANHEYEVELPANKGRMSMSGLKEVDTNNSNKLNKALAYQEAMNLEREDRLKAAGIVVARAVFKHAVLAGIDYRCLDDQIAGAVQTINHRQA